MKFSKNLSPFVVLIAASLFVFNACTKEDNKTQVTASFTIDMEMGDSPLLVNFTNSSTNAVSYKWNFDDGTSSTEKDPSHSFINTSSSSEMNFTVTLTSTAANNSSATSSKVITVSTGSIIFNSALTYGTMSDQEGNIYKTIKIGTQTWMAENLRVTTYSNGDSINNVTKNSTWVALKTGGFCNYDNTTSNDIIDIYGRLYNWYTVTDSRNIAPVGWHVPTDEEWSILTSYLGGENVAGGKMKETGIIHWTKPSTNATNESGFTALPTGSRYSIVGTFNDLGNNSYLWSSTSNSATHAWNRYISNGANCRRGFDYKTDGFPVRLIKD